MKKFFAILLALITVCGVCACKKAADLDFSKLELNVSGFGENIIKNSNFGITPEAADSVDSQLEQMRIDPADLKTVDGKPECFYASTGMQSADFVLVLGAKDVDTAKKLSDEQVAQWLESLKKDAGYEPTEADKLNDCFTKVAGRYIFVICSADSAAAEKALNELLTNAVQQNG